MVDLELHGGDVYSYYESTGKKPLDYSANINPLGLPPEVKSALSGNMDSFCDYPDISCRELRAAVAAYEQTDQENLIFGNGAADIIYRLCYTLKPQKALLLAPTFVEYGQALSSTGCSIEYCELSSEKDYQVDEKILNHISGKDILFICNPNNPTGMLTDNGLLYRIAGKCKEEGCNLVIDECFMDFVTEKETYSFKKYLSEFDNVIILKAFTKIFAMPGLRLGYCLCTNSDIVRRIEHTGQSWSVSVPAQLAGVAALQAKDYLEETLILIPKERKYLTDNLKQLGIKVYKSYTNFILLQTDCEDLYNKLYQKGILIRKCGNFKGLNNTFYRIAVKDRDSNQRLIQALKEII